MSSNLQIQFLGHNAWHLTVDGKHILVDPFLTHNPSAACTAEDVEADLILVSHGHGDHFGDAISIAKRTGAVVAAIAEIAGYAEKHGVKSTEPMNLGGSIDLPYVRVKMVPALHSSTLPDGTPGGNSAGFLLTFKAGTRLYFACDTAFFSDMRFFGKDGLDCAFLPIGDRFTMGPDDALEAVKLLKPKVTVPCHFSTWPLIEQDPAAWKARVEAETESNVLLLKSGESFTI